MDIEQMMLSADELDTGAIESWLSRMVGPGDQRLKRLNELVASSRVGS
jgi:hypothetical protein